MRFYKLYESLINELTKDETEKAISTKKKYDDYGPLFKKERTIIHTFKLNPDFLLKQLSLLLSKNKTDIKVDSLTKDVEAIINHNLKNKVKNINIEDNKVTLDDNREMKITKILSKNKNDVEFFIVISHNPVDIAGMSTDKGWKSCMNLRDGTYNNTPFDEIKHGGMVAYFVKGKSEDMNKIMNDHKENGLFHQNAISRIAIKRFVNVNENSSFLFKSERACYSVVGVDKLIRNEKINFVDIVDEVLDKSNEETKKHNSTYKRNSSSYSDNLDIIDDEDFDSDDLDKLDDNELLEIFNKSPEYIEYVEDMSIDLQYEILELDPYLTYLIQNVKPRVVAQALSDMDMYSKETETFIRNLYNRDNGMDVIADVIDYDPSLLYPVIESGVIDEDEIAYNLLDKGFRFDESINYFSDEVKKIILDSDPDDVSYIEEPSEEIINFIIKNYPSSYSEIDDHYQTKEDATRAIKNLGSDGIKKNKMYVKNEKDGDIFVNGKEKDGGFINGYRFSFADKEGTELVKKWQKYPKK